MTHRYDPLTAYGTVARRIMKILTPYEKYLRTMVKQEDSLCLYTHGYGGSEGSLFAAVQILSSGVSFTVYDPGKSYHSIFDCLPAKMKALYKGNYRFHFTRINDGLVAEIKDLLLALFGTYSLGKYFHLHHEAAAGGPLRGT